MSRRILAIEPGVAGQTGAALRIEGLLRHLQGPSGLRQEGLSREPAAGGVCERFEVVRCGIHELCEGLRPLPRSSDRWRFLFGRPAWVSTFDATDRSGLRQRLMARIEEVDADLLWVAHGSVAAQLGLESRASIRIPLVIDAYDLLWTARERRLMVSAGDETLRRLRIQMEIHRARRFELDLYGAADQVWVCSELDRRRLAETSIGDKAVLVPNFFEFPGHDGAPDDRREDRLEDEDPEKERGSEPTVVFVGAMGYYPNRQGMEWWLSSVWPIVLEERPDAVLKVIGRWPDWAEPASCYDQPGVEVLGYVEDLDAALDRPRSRHGHPTPLATLQCRPLY